MPIDDEVMFRALLAEQVERVAKLEERLKGLRIVWDRYRHLGRVLYAMDEPSLQDVMLREAWAAISKAIGEDIPHASP